MASGTLLYPTPICNGHPLWGSLKAGGVTDNGPAYLPALPASTCRGAAAMPSTLTVTPPPADLVPWLLDPLGGGVSGCLSALIGVQPGRTGTARLVPR